MVGIEAVGATDGRKEGENNQKNQAQGADRKGTLRQGVPLMKGGRMHSAVSGREPDS